MPKRKKGEEKGGERKVVEKGKKIEKEGKKGKKGKEKRLKKKEREKSGLCQARLSLLKSTQGKKRKKEEGKKRVVMCRVH